MGQSQLDRVNAVLLDGDGEAVSIGANCADRAFEEVDLGGLADVAIERQARDTRLPVELDEAK